MVNPPLASRPKKSRTGLYLIVGIVLLVLVGGGVAMKNRNQAKVTPVTAGEVVTRTITQLVTATGKVRPEIEVKIVPEVSGEIVDLPFREGASVKKGDLLLRIKDDNYRYLIDQREADLAAARAAAVQNGAQLLQAEEEFQRNDDLYERKLISEAAYTAARTAVEVARANRESSLAQIRRAEGQLKQAQDQLEKTVIHSPINGTISLLAAELGERVAGTGQFNAAEIMRVADLGNMEAVVEVNENDVINVNPGNTAAVSIDAFPRAPFEGVVTEIASTAKTLGQGSQEQVTNFEVKIRLTTGERTLRPGMSATADIATKTVVDAVAVPIQSVTVRGREDGMTLEQLAAAREKDARQSGGEGSEGAATAVNAREQREREQRDRDALQRVVFVIEDETVKQVPVESGITDTTHMEITGGLEPGQKIVTGNFTTITRTLKDGMAVKVETPRAAGAAAKK